MTLRDRVPVEPLAPERMERLEQRIVAAAAPMLARPARAPLWPWGLALASAAAAALAVYALRPPPAPPAGGPLATITHEGADEGATIELGDATIHVGARTRFDVTRAGGGIDVRLDHGAVTLDVAPRRGRPPLWVHAGDVGVRVVGTAFTVTRAPGAGEVDVEVSHGTVEVHREGRVAAVTGGQRWSSRDGAVLAAAPSPPLPAEPPAADEPTGPGRIGAAGSHTPDLATGPAIDVAVLDERRPGGRLAGVPGVTGRSVDNPGAGRGDSDDGRAGSPRTDGRGGPPKPRADARAPADPASELRQRILAQPLAPAVAVPGTTADERLTAYRRAFTEQTGADASAALYGMARTQHVDLGKHPDALRSLDLYVKRFPQGNELTTVLWLRLRILCRARFDEPCRAAAYTYLKRDTDSPRGRLAVLLTNER